MTKQQSNNAQPLEQRRGIIANYRHCLPLPNNAPAITLGEGNTPLLQLRRPPLPAALADNVEIYVKVEGANPTASFKDRGMVTATAAAVANGVKCMLCASTGNTSASAAAYAACVNLPCVVLIPEGQVAAGKIAQAVAHGAHIIRIEGNFDDAMSAVKKYSDSGIIGVVNSINPMRLQGQKTASLEIIAALGGAPDYHALPVGNAGNITACWIGYCEAAEQKTQACSYCNGDCQFINQSVTVADNGAQNRPRMLGYQAEKSAPFVYGLPVTNPDTVATAIRIGNPQSYEAARIVIAESDGRIGAVSDEEILKTQRYLAAQEGVFCEPASAASVAGVLRDLQNGNIKTPSRIVCTLTGHGLKDTDIIGKPKISTVSDISGALEDILSRHA